MKNKISIIILTLIVGISIGVFGLSFYQNLNDTSDNNIQNENNNPNKEGENNQIVTISYNNANKLLMSVMNQPASVTHFFSQNPNKISMSIDEIPAVYLGYMLKQSTKLEQVKVCGTEHETNLKTLNFIGEKGKGQFDCESPIFYTVDSIKLASIDVFGKELSQFTKETTNKNDPYYYYTEGKMGIIRYTGAWQYDYVIDDYYINSSILSIECSSKIHEDAYKLDFKLENSNFYFERITQI